MDTEETFNKIANKEQGSSPPNGNTSWLMGPSDKRNRGQFPQKRDIYGLPNVFIGLVSTPDQNVLTYKAENHNADSDLSIERRGYKLTKVYKLDSIASQQELEDYVNKLLTDSMMAVEGVTISTTIQPGHDFQNCLQIEHDDLSGLYIEKSWSYSLDNGAAMQHYAEKKVFV